MLKLPSIVFCFLLLQRPFVESRGNSRAKQCGDFCLAALHPLIDDSSNIRNRLDGIEAGQSVLKDSCGRTTSQEDLWEGLQKGLREIQTKMDAQFLVLQTRLESCKIKTRSREPFRALKIAADANDILKSQLKIKDDLINEKDEQIKIKEDLINKKDEHIKIKEDLIKNIDEQNKIKEDLINKKDEQIKIKEDLINKKDIQIRKIINENRDLRIHVDESSGSGDGSVDYI
ncbi:uncharacterized protein LOC108037965 [Drosophila rhopaloa]|uniref:Uncharacterized protein n=1 Tax=Drosophila rhopaloa TaxID=1041015 RepID=A0ABM5GVG1_DRORH|nr:uncharacterized protein LOC108037965 [Drosophila rhopaloa]